jgi:nucleoside-specific outer membrane channel protein Tsx
LLKILLITSTIEFGKGDVESFMIGPAIDFNIPGFDYFNFNIYQHFTKNDRDGETIQVTPVWKISHNLWGEKFIFEGFIDWNVNSDGNYHSNIHFNPRLKYDLDKLLNLKTGSAMLGIEYSYWKNKYGIKSSPTFDTNQSAISLILNYSF